MFQDIKKVFSRVRAALRGRGASSHDAEDWAQEAWLRMSTHLEGQSVPNPEGYLTRTAINISRDAYRARSGFDDVAVEELPLVDVAPGLDDQMLNKERLDRMRQCLERMPARTLQIFLAHRVDNLSYAEVGREFGLSKTVVAKHVNKATVLLNCWMEGW